MLIPALLLSLGGCRRKENIYIPEIHDCTGEKHSLVIIGHSPAAWSLMYKDKFFSHRNDQGFFLFRKNFGLPSLEGLEVKKWLQLRDYVRGGSQLTPEQESRVTEFMEICQKSRIDPAAVREIAERMPVISAATEGNRIDSKIASLAIVSLLLRIKESKSAFYLKYRAFIDTVLEKVALGRLILKNDELKDENSESKSLKSYGIYDWKRNILSLSPETLEEPFFNFVRLIAQCRPLAGWRVS